MKIVIIKPSALGDIVQSLPVLTGLRRQWPDAQIDWIVNDNLKDILAGHPALNRAIGYPRKRWRSLYHLPEMRRWTRRLRLQKYDLSIDLQGLFRTGMMTWAAGAQRRLGLQSAREGARFFYNETILDNPLSAAERYLTCLEYLRIPLQPYDFQLKARVPLPQAAASFGSYIALHPYSRWETKLWPWRYYQELIDSLPDRRFIVVGEGPWFPLMAPARLLDLRGKLTLAELVTVLDRAQGLLSTDSGPAHISGALGKPTLVLFGATDWRKTKPVGLKVEAHHANLFCSPCLKRTCWRDEPMECMVMTPPEKVKKILVKLVS